MGSAEPRQLSSGAWRLQCEDHPTSPVSWNPDGDHFFASCKCERGKFREIIEGIRKGGEANGSATIQRGLDVAQPAAEVADGGGESQPEDGEQARPVALGSARIGETWERREERSDDAVVTSDGGPSLNESFNQAEPESEQVSGAPGQTQKAPFSSTSAKEAPKSHSNGSGPKQSTNDAGHGQSPSGEALRAGRGGFEANGAALYRTPLKQWREMLLMQCFRFLKGDPEYRDKAVPAATLLEPMIADLKGLVALHLSSGILPPELSETDQEEEIQGQARTAIEHWAGYKIWSKEGPVEAATEEDPFAGRHAVDAYQGYVTMVGEQIFYPIAKLVRGGGSLAFSGLMGSGKTTTLMQAVFSLATGEDFLDRRVIPGRVFVVASPKEYDNWLEVVGFWQLQERVYILPSVAFHWGDVNKSAKHFEFEMSRCDCSYFVLDTLFDFYGLPANSSGDQNRIAMNEQAPLLDIVRARRWAGLVSGHQPKSEAQAVTPRDPEEAFAGNTGWMAQHRMRASLRRKSQGYNAIITGKGGYGDEGILKEHLLVFNEETRHVTLGGLFADHLGQAAMPEVIDCLTEAGTWMARTEIDKRLGKSKNWSLAGLREGMKAGDVASEGEGRARKYILATYKERQQTLV